MNKEKLVEDARKVGYIIAGQYIGYRYAEGTIDSNFDFDSVSFCHKIMEVIDNLEVPFSGDFVNIEDWRNIIDTEVIKLCNKEHI